MGKALAFFALSLWLEVEVGLNRPLLEVASFERPPTLLPSAKRASCEDENMKKSDARLLLSQRPRCKRAFLLMKSFLFYLILDLTHCTEST